MPEPPSKISWPLVLAGYATLVLAAYLDNVRGPILPLLGRELALDFEATGWFLTVGQLAGIGATLALAAAGGRTRARTLALAAGAAALAPAVVAPLVGGVPTLMLLAALIGGGIATMGMICNLLVVQGAPERWRGRALAGLHTMYGVGSLGAGMVVAQAVGSGVGWRTLIWGVAPVAAGMLGAFFLGVRPTPVEVAPPRPRSFDGRGAFGFPQIIAVAALGIYVLGEVGTSMWLASFLVEARGMAPETAATYVSGFFLVLLVARLATALFVQPRHETTLVVLSLVLPTVAFAVGYWIDARAFALVGLVGPFFPLYLSLLSRLFRETWSTVAASVFLSMQAGLATLNVGVGRFADAVGLERAFLVPLAMLALATALLVVHLRLSSRPGALS